MKKSIVNSNKNKLGQYFTPELIADFMVSLSDVQKTSTALEPSSGEGVFLKALQARGYRHLVAYEIDEALCQAFSCVRYESFVSAKVNEKFDLIIGNPPYIRWKNLEPHLKEELLTHSLWNRYCNSLCDYLYIFILKSIELLNEDGQLIFICPEYWMNTAHSAALRNYMVLNGYFEAIYHFNETPIFDNATVSTIIFKYVKSKHRQNRISVAKFYAKKKLTQDILSKLKTQSELTDAEYMSVRQFELNKRWLLMTDAEQERLASLEKKCSNQQSAPADLFNEAEENYHTIAEYCDIGNGLVSGLDKAFQLNGHTLNPLEKSSLLDVIKAKDLKPYIASQVTKYIYIKEGLTEDTFAKNYPNFYQHFQSFKSDLEKRYQYNRKINYWEWVFLRNFNLFSQGDKRIFVPCKERISNKNHFRFSLVEKDIFPTQDVTAIFRKPSTKESIEYLLAYLNNHRVFEWLKHKGVVKGSIVEFSEKPIASIPFRAINWQKSHEVQLHDAITQTMTTYLKNQQEAYLAEANQLLNVLLES